MTGALTLISPTVNFRWYEFCFVVGMFMDTSLFPVTVNNLKSVSVEQQFVHAFFGTKDKPFCFFVFLFFLFVTATLHLGLKMAKDKFNVDQILEKLLSVRGAQPGKMVELTEAQITGEDHHQSSYKIKVCNYNWQASKS